jgi:cytochrome P450
MPNTENFTVDQLLRPDVIANPYPYYDLLREQLPQFGLLDYPPGTVPGQDVPRPAWVFLKYADVSAISRNNEVFSSRDIMQEESEAPTLMLVNHDKPRHTVLRALAQKAFTPKRVGEDVGPWAEKTVADMCERTGAGEIDFMENFAVEVPARFMTRLIGTPEKDWPELRKWGNAFMVTSDFTAEERNQCNKEIAEYYQAAVLERRADMQAGKTVPDDLMSAFLTAEHEGNTLTVEEVIRFCITLVVAGAETTVYFLGNLVQNLAQDPELFQALKQDRTLVRPFLEETLRRDGPPQRLFRVATQDIEIGGAHVRAGDWIAVFYAAANRDPSVFENPNELILNRPNIKRHLTFGHGIHHCMGSNVARMEGDKVVNGLLNSFSAILPGKTPMVRQSGGLLNYGLENCPVNLVR